jgi:hypothetical protein
MQNATVQEWYRVHGRHPVYAKGQELPLPEYANPISARLAGEPLRLKVIGQ